jgi:hypothetical protein
VHPRNSLANQILIILAIVIVVAVVMIAALGLRRRSAPVVSQQLIEQSAIQYVQRASPGTITQVTSKRITLGQLFGNPSCSLAQNLIRMTTLMLGLDTYNACNPNTLLWVVDLHGTFNFSGPAITSTTNFVQVVLDSRGNFIKADSGPITP